MGVAIFLMLSAGYSSNFNFIIGHRSIDSYQKQFFRELTVYFYADGIIFLERFYLSNFAYNTLQLITTFQMWIFIGIDVMMNEHFLFAT